MLEMRIRQERPCSPSYPAARRPCSPFLEPLSAVTKVFSDVCGDRKRRRTTSDLSSFWVDASSPSGDSLDRRYSETLCDTATPSSSSFSPFIKSERSCSPITPQSASESSSSSCSLPSNGATKRACSPSSLHPPKKKWIHCYLAVGDSSEDGAPFIPKSCPSPHSQPSPSLHHTSSDQHRSPHHHPLPTLRTSPPHHPSTPTHHTSPAHHTPATQYSPLSATSSPGIVAAVALTPSTPHLISRSAYSPSPVVRTSLPNPIRFSSGASPIATSQTPPSRVSPYTEESLCARPEDGRLRGSSCLGVTSAKQSFGQPSPPRSQSQTSSTALAPSYAVVNNTHQSNGFSGSCVGVKTSANSLETHGGGIQQPPNASSSGGFGRSVGGSPLLSSPLPTVPLGRAPLTVGSGGSGGVNGVRSALLEPRQRPQTAYSEESSHKQQGHLPALAGEGLNGLSRLNGSVFRSLPDRADLTTNQTSYLQQAHYAAAPAPLTPLSREDSAKRRPGSVTNTPSREVHNKLEKNRRAHLKECFDLLRRQISNMDDKKVSNQNILKAAYKCINSLKRKERDFEHEMERLAREKISHQQHLASLKKELAARWDHIDFSTLLPDMATLDHHRDKDTKSTTTASEQPDLMEEELPPPPPTSLQRAGVLPPHSETNFGLGGRFLPNGIHSSSGTGVLLQYHRGPSTATSAVAAESLLSSALPGHRSSILGNGVHRSVVPMVIPSSPVTLVRASAASHMTVSPALSYGKPLQNRQSPVVTYTTCEPLGLTSVVTYTPQPSPQPGLLGTCTHHISPQTTPVMTYTPQHSPQSPNSGCHATQTTLHTFSAAPSNTILTPATNSVCKIQQRESYQDPNQPLNLSTNTGIIAPLRSNASLSSVHLSPISPSKALVESSDEVLSNIQQSTVQTQTSSPSWFVQQHQGFTNDQLQKVELKIVDGVNTAQIIRPLHTVSKVVSMPSMDGLTEAHCLRQPNVSSAQIVAKLSPSTVTYNPTHIPQNISFCPPSSTFSLQQPTSTSSIPSSHSHLMAPKTHPSHNLNQGLPVQISMSSCLTTTSDANASFISNAGGEGYTVRLASSATTFVHPSSGNNAHHLQNATALMPIVQSGGGLHHIPVRIAASGGGLVNILTPELGGGYKLISADHAFTNGAKPITIALPQEDMLPEGGIGGNEGAKASAGGSVMVAVTRNGLSALHVAMPTATRCLRLSSDKQTQGVNGPAAPLNLSTSPTPVYSSAADHSHQQQHGTTLRLTPTSVMPSYIPFTPSNGMSQLVSGMMVTPVVMSPAMSGAVNTSCKVSNAVLPAGSLAGDGSCVGQTQSANGGGKPAALVLPGPYSGHFPGAALVVVSSAGVEPRTFAASPAIIASHATSKTTAIYATQTN